MTETQPEPWLRGPVPGVPALLQPAAHAFLQAQEDVERAARALRPDELWLEPGGAASVGFHLAHLSGATDRLLTYARGERLSDAQKKKLAAERPEAAARPTLDALLAEWRAAVADAIGQLAAIPEEALLTSRFVGRAQLPSNVLGLAFHAAEHASRHTGQVVTTCKIIVGNRR
ncbi:MAG: DinB family protein [Gemmatimonadetes bacterium]|nr:DinB family protein [Gemmatimonadota bacterium]